MEKTLLWHMSMEPTINTCFNNSADIFTQVMLPWPIVIDLSDNQFSGEAGSQLTDSSIENLERPDLTSIDSIPPEIMVSICHRKPKYLNDYMC